MRRRIRRQRAVFGAHCGLHLSRSPEVALTGDWIRVERVPGMVGSLWLRALGGVQGGAMYGFARGAFGDGPSVMMRLIFCREWQDQE